jgi:hypothetical protein
LKCSVCAATRKVTGFVWAEGEMPYRQPHNKQLQRTVIPNRWRGASAPFHCAPAARWIARRAAAELRRSARVLAGLA